MMEPSPALTAVMHSGVCSSRMRRLRMAAAYTSLFSHLQGQRSGMRKEHEESPHAHPVSHMEGFYGDTLIWNNPE